MIDRTECLFKVNQKDHIFLSFNPPVTASLLAWQEILRWSLPLLSVWSHPHRLGTVSVHFLCTFMSHAAIPGLVIGTDAAVSIIFN